MKQDINVTAPDSVFYESEKIALRTLAEIADEIQNKFNLWNVHKENGQEPVPIQDLDYWQNQINRAVVVLRNVLNLTPGQVEK